MNFGKIPTFNPWHQVRIDGAWTRAVLASGDQYLHSGYLWQVESTWVLRHQMLQEWRKEKMVEVLQGLSLQNPDMHLSLTKAGSPQKIQVWRKRGFQNLVLDMLNLRCQLGSSSVMVNDSLQSELNEKGWDRITLEVVGTEIVVQSSDTVNASLVM
jgi:hypothetical protein